MTNGADVNHPQRSACAAALLLWLGSLNPWAVAHEEHNEAPIAAEATVAQWSWRPAYQLPRSAQHLAQESAGIKSAAEDEFSRESLPLRLAGRNPTERRRRLLRGSELPRGEFAFEAWVNCHVNQPIGFAAVAGGVAPANEERWALAFHTFYGPQPRVVARLTDRHGTPVELAYDLGDEEGFQEYWRHIVLCYDGSQATLFLNGRQCAATEIAMLDAAPGSEFEIAAYLQHEPEMQLANLVREARLYDRALDIAEVQRRFDQLSSNLEHGFVRSQGFEFLAGPYLNSATQTSMRILWETSRPASARVEWGPTSSLGDSAWLKDRNSIQEFEITGLRPQTPYFYRITAIDQDESELSSGVLTFQTAVEPEAPFRFAVLGDTETRPHVNHALSKQIWGERPNFVVVLGDLTDGGMQGAKWQWNQEYFAGVAGLCSRVPFFPVPGNGEADLYWYKRYHSLPGDESPYAFRYGNAEFFMLDSNLRQKEFAPDGRQHRWLEKRLTESQATWKFVCFHHAPFTSDEDDYGDSWNQLSSNGDEAVRQLAPLLETQNVDVVMFGHIHSYERSRRLRSLRSQESGVLYLLCGGGGGNLEDFAPNPVGFSSKVHRGHHYCLIDVDGGQFELRMYRLDGAMLDVFRMQKTASSAAPIRQASAR